MTSPHQDAADLVAELRRHAEYVMSNFPDDVCSRAANLIEQQAKALSEAEERCAKLVRDVICTIDWPPTDGDTLIDALQSAIRTGKVS